MGLADVKKLDAYNTRGGGGYRDQLKSLMGGDAENPTEERREGGKEEPGEPAPGTPAYLQRRQKQGEADLRNAPRMK